MIYCICVKLNCDFFLPSFNRCNITILFLSSRVELLDYLDSIDCSLEDFQAMLSGRQFSIDPDLLFDVIFIES